MYVPGAKARCGTPTANSVSVTVTDVPAEALDGCPAEVLALVPGVFVPPPLQAAASKPSAASITVDSPRRHLDRSGLGVDRQSGMGVTSCTIRPSY
ncbi:hypothetical protein GCM10022380_88210 [Amycolatopsis tucumanensis]|uniref:Uncharacterized protein n=1 Tax=Amycolatopsis tucumanensis TaxID=401106 RepID=A0ABP7JX44_9PSEU